MADNYTLVKNKESQLSDLYARMDASKNRVYMDDYVLKDTQGKKIKGAISVTMNDPAVFADSMVNSLLKAKWQTSVNSKNKRFPTYRIEQFLNDVEIDGNERLAARGEPDLDSWICNHVIIRSYIGCRFLYLFDANGQLYPNFLPVDMRHTPFEYSTNGLAWVAPKFWLSGDQIRADFPEINYTGEGADIEVCDFWSATENEVFVAGRSVRKQSNPYGRPPFAIARPSTGFMLRDKGYLKHEAEDAFFLNEKLYDEWNRTISIEQTLNMKAIMPPYQKSVEDFAEEPAPYPDQTGKVNEVLKGEEYQLLQVADVNKAHQMATQALSGAIQRGGVNNVDLGNVNQAVSAVNITDQAEIRQKILEPRMKCLAAFKQQMARLKLEFYIAGQYRADLGESGAKTVYDFKDLGDPKTYSIGYAMHAKSSKMEIARLAIAQGSRGILSEETIVRDVLEMDDPDGELDRLEYEKAEQADPILFYFRKAYALAVKASFEEGDTADKLKIESMFLTNKGVELIRSQRIQTRQGTLQAAATATAKPNSNTLIPMLQQPISNQSAIKTGGGESESVNQVGT